MRKKIYGILSLMLFLSLCFLLPEHVLADGAVGDGSGGSTSETVIPGYTFYTIDGEPVSTEGDGKSVTVLIFGKTDCGITQGTVRNIAASDWVKSPDIRVIFAALNTESTDVVKNFKNAYGCENIIFCPQSYYVPEAWNEYCNQFSLSTRSFEPGSFPHIFLLDAANHPKKGLSGSQTAATILAEIQKFSDPGYEERDPLLTLNMSGEESYAYARSVFAIVNQKRAENGRPRLELDKELTEAAMQRAAELSLYYNHTRPNGEKATSILRRDGCTRIAENIAVGYLTPDAVMSGWMSSQGHKANILDLYLKGIGIGCFRDNQGIWYWVQYFDDKQPCVPLTENGSRQVTRPVSIRSSVVNLSVDETAREFSCSGAGTTAAFGIYHLNRAFPYSRPQLNPGDFDFTSSNASVATAGADGTIAVGEPGTAVIKATIKKSAVSVSLNVTKKEHTLKDEVIAPTKTEQGYTVHTCTVCGYSFTDSYVPAVPEAEPGSPGEGDGGAGSGDGNSDSSGNGNSDSPGNGSTSGSDGSLGGGSSSGSGGVGSGGTGTGTVGGSGGSTGGGSSQSGVRNVSGLTAGSKEKTITLSWRKVSGAKGYFVYQRNNTKKKWVKIATVKPGTTTYTVRKLKPGTAYRFAVKAYATKNKKQVTSKSYTSVDVATKPSAVKFTVTAGKGKATFKWSKVKGATGYTIYYKRKETDAFRKLGSTKKTSFTKTGLDSGKYIFTVRAYKTCGGRKYMGTSAAKTVKIN